MSFSKIFFNDTGKRDLRFSKPKGIRLVVSSKSWVFFLFFFKKAQRPN